SCPGRSAVRSGALLNRDTHLDNGKLGPGSAVHRCALHRVRGTSSVNEKRRAPWARRSRVGTGPTITFQRGTAAGGPACHLGGTARRLPTADCKYAILPGASTIRSPACQPCDEGGPRQQGRVQKFQRCALATRK